MSASVLPMAFPRPMRAFAVAYQGKDYVLRARNGLELREALMICCDIPFTSAVSISARLFRGEKIETRYLRAGEK